LVRQRRGLELRLKLELLRGRVRFCAQSKHANTRAHRDGNVSTMKRGNRIRSRASRAQRGSKTVDGFYTRCLIVYRFPEKHINKIWAWAQASDYHVVTCPNPAFRCDDGHADTQQ
jgi:hypothetical protein